jgi:hypothetical protein
MQSQEWWGTPALGVPLRVLEPRGRTAEELEMFGLGVGCEPGGLVRVVGSRPRYVLRRSGRSRLLAGEDRFEHCADPRRVFERGGVSSALVLPWAGHLRFRSNFVLDEARHFALGEVGGSGLVDALQASHRLVLSRAQRVAAATRVADFGRLVPNQLAVRSLLVAEALRDRRNRRSSRQTRPPDLVGGRRRPDQRVA